MRRCEFIKILAAAIGVPALPATAQESRTYRIGVLNHYPRRSPVVTAIFDELRRNGFVEGRNLTVALGLATHRLQYLTAQRRAALNAQGKSMALA